jgi:sigma-B regulation protein RsbU (phosphoserine phosphatase)
LSENPLLEAPGSGVELDFEDLFETAPCGYLSTDRNGRITRANGTFAGWIGIAADNLVGKRFSELLSTACRTFYETQFAPILRMQGSFSQVALDIVAADGRILPSLVDAIERRDGDGRIGFIRLTVFVATERRAYERNLLRERNEAQAEVKAAHADSDLREQFIAVLGHDLRNPVASIVSGIRMLDKEELSERGRMVLRLMEGSAVRAFGLIDNVMDFARGRLGGGITLSRDAREPLETVLRQVVEELRSIAPERQVDVLYFLDEPVDCDRLRIGQLGSNLLGNALTHGLPGTPVRLEARTVDGNLTIEVANSGKPIAEDTMARLFQPFQRGTGRGQGLGLGLHIASEIARAHGGMLAVRSDDGETRFTFTMPLMNTAR